jgi:2-polyprenyl-3-methyl-5-hydroxy-6-metoxy-1,4-benzoquinol methylase
MNKNYKFLEWTDENIKKFWNFWDLESQYDELYFTYQLGDFLVKSLSNYFPHARTVLDYGSGRGHLIKPLIKHNLHVSALEFSDQAINLINNKYNNTQGFEGVYSLQEIKKIKKKFDLIFLVEIIEHLNDRELKNTIENVNKLLVKNGIVIITTPNDEILLNSMVCCPECQKIFHRWQHIRSWNEDSLKNYLLAKEFTIVDIFVTDLNHEKQRQNLTFRQKIVSYLYEKDRKWVYKPHLICIIKK